MKLAAFLSALLLSTSVVHAAPVYWCKERVNNKICNYECPPVYGYSCKTLDKGCPQKAPTLHYIEMSKKKSAYGIFLEDQTHMLCKKFGSWDDTKSSYDKEWESLFGRNQ